MKAFSIQACCLFLQVLYCQLLSSNEECMNENVVKATKNEMDQHMKSCMADCLGLLKRDKVCKFHTVTGGADGKCDEDFRPLSNDRMLGCEYYWESFSKSKSVTEKICDFIVFKSFLGFEKGSRQRLVEYNQEIADAMPYIKKANAKGVKTWMQIGSYNDDEMQAKDFSEMTANAAQRSKLITLISDSLEKYKMDGVYLFWRYPGCPEVKCATQFMKDRASAIAFYRELAMALQETGKVVVSYWHALHTSEMNYLGSDFQQIVQKYTNYTIFEVSGQMGLDKDTLNSSRNLLLMESLFNNVFRVFGPNLKKKAILSRDIYFMRFSLLEPSKNTIGSKYNKSSSIQDLNLTEICNLFNRNAFTKVKSSTKQPYAYSNTDWVPYEDIDHVKLEVERLVKKFDMAGIFLEKFYNDDADGQCGAGRLPYSRMYAEALKGGFCTFKDFLK